MKSIPLTVFHIIDEFSISNHGILEAALGTAQLLSEEHSISSEIWFPTPKISELDHLKNFDFRGAKAVEISGTRKPLSIFSNRPETENHCIVVMSHGSWGMPTKLGYRLSKKAPWIYTPHGMLEPWSMNQKKWKKKPYWKLIEQPRANHASIVRATSIPEYRSLTKLFSNVQLHTHGVPLHKPTEKSYETIRFLFMGRLHPKKAPANLVEAWINSSLNGNKTFELVIVGNDDGELSKIKSLIAQSKGNVRLEAPKFGTEKDQLFSNCHFFVLPSHSEGFPMALLEGMASGLIPVISEGCNLPDAISSRLAIKVSPSQSDIRKGIEKAMTLPIKELIKKQKQTIEFIDQNFSLQSMAKSQAELYQSLVKT